MFNLIKSLEEAHDLMYAMSKGGVDADHYRRVATRMEEALTNFGITFTPLLDSYVDKVIAIVDRGNEAAQA
jgi:hypothetical protein